MPDSLRVIFEDVYAQGIALAFLVAVPLAIVALIAILFLPNLPLGRMTTSERLHATRADLATHATAEAMQTLPATGPIPVVTAAQGQHPAEDPEESRAVAAERPATASPVAGRPVAPAALAVAGTALLAAVVTALVRARRG